MNITSRDFSLNFFKKLILLALVTLISGCASIPGGTPSEGDPFESYNRAVFKFNEGVDEYFLEPVARGYDKIMPSPVKTGVSNFFSNLGDIFVIINDILQFKFGQAASDTLRFMANSTLGFFGLIDVATEMGLPKHREDFGQTLATWGVSSGPYFVLPFFGPSTIRDTGGFAVKTYYDPVYEIEPDSAMYGTVILRAVDTRYQLLEANEVANRAALDKYSFVRDAYLQIRRSLIYDGNPPREAKDFPPETTKEDESLELELELELEKELNP